MNFTLPKELNENLILSKITEEQIMAYYLRVPMNGKLFCSPLRQDKKPTCSLFRSPKGKLIFKDFATGQYLDCFNVVMALFNCSYWESLRIIANDFHIISDDSIKRNPGKVISKNVKVEEKEFSEIRVEIQDFTESELKWWSKFGITKQILKKFNVFSCKHVFLNGRLLFKTHSNYPTYGYYGRKYKGKELWKIYRPKNVDSKWLSNWPSKKLQGYEYLPKSGKLVCITKSLKDAMTLYSLGIASCAPNSETVIPSKTIIDDLKKRFQYIVCLWDNDYTGISFLNKFRKMYPDLNYIFIPRKYEAKDISDFYAKYGKEKTQLLIKDYLLWLKEKNTMIS